MVATVSHLLQTPAVATAIAHELGTGQAAAFDISAACSGFCHGISLASDFVRAGSAKHVLVIGVERLTDILDLTDRGTAFIFADGAGAAVVTSDTPGIGPVVWGSDGEQFDLIRQREDWRNVVGSPEVPGSGVMPHLVMQGNPVFRWASIAVAQVAQPALDSAGISLDDLDAFVPHQANLRIVDSMARSMAKLPSDRVARDVVDAGNTSAASVPLAVARLLSEGTSSPATPCCWCRSARALVRRPGRHRPLTVTTVTRFPRFTTTAVAIRKEGPMATTEEIRADLAEIVNDESEPGRPARPGVQRRRRSRRPTPPVHTP